ncbi:hypothetical protein [Sorangium sp. So ce394]|uniref:hypothetical protein n=1 Tax=Sorangium sp. So ce394 TaxID=3133310 RepID=UPI003F5B38E6
MKTAGLAGGGAAVVAIAGTTLIGPGAGILAGTFFAGAALLRAYWSSPSNSNQRQDQDTNETADQDTNETADQDTNETADQDTNETADQDTNETADQDTNETADQDTNETADQDADQGTNETADQDANQHREETAVEDANQTASKRKKKRKNKKKKPTKDSEPGPEQDQDGHEWVDPRAKEKKKSAERKRRKANAPQKTKDSRQEDVGYPPRTEGTDRVADAILGRISAEAAREGQSHKSPKFQVKNVKDALQGGRAIAVLLGSDGKYYIGISGSADNAGVILDQVSIAAPGAEIGVYPKGGDLDKVTIGSHVHQGGVSCAEPKAFDKLPDGVHAVGMTVVWAAYGEKALPNPCRDEKAEAGDYMHPCPSCAANADTIMKKG